MENRCSKSEPKIFLLESRALRCDSTGNRNAVSIPVSFGCLAVVASGVGFVFGFVFVLVLGLVLEFEFDVELGFVFGFVLLEFAKERK